MILNFQDGAWVIFDLAKNELVAGGYRFLEIEKMPLQFLLCIVGQRQAFCGDPGFNF